LGKNKSQSEIIGRDEDNNAAVENQKMVAIDYEQKNLERLEAIK
jgi:hypothetical protein